MTNRNPLLGAPLTVSYQMQNGLHSSQHPLSPSRVGDDDEIAVAAKAALLLRVPNSTP